MKLTDLRRRIAALVADIPPELLMDDPPAKPAELEPLEAPPITPLPGDAVPLTADQRVNLEKLRDQLAPDRQNRHDRRK